MELSVLPGSNFAICAHLLPYLHPTCVTAYVLERWSDPPPPSICPCWCPGWDGCASALDTASRSCPAGAWPRSSNFLGRGFWPAPVLVSLLPLSLLRSHYPWSLYQSRVQHFLPPMQALHIRSLLQKRGNFFPVSSPVLLHQQLQFLVLGWRPPVLLRATGVHLCWRLRKQYLLNGVVLSSEGGGLRVWGQFGKGEDVGEDGGWFGGGFGGGEGSLWLWILWEH